MRGGKGGGDAEVSCLGQLVVAGKGMEEDLLLRAQVKDVGFRIVDVSSVVGGRFRVAMIAASKGEGNE